MADSSGGRGYRLGSLRSAIGHYLSGRLTQAIAGVVVMLVMVREMTIDDYALYLTASAFASLLGGLSILGIDRVVTRYVPEGILIANIEDLGRFLRLIGLSRVVTVAGLSAAVVASWPIVGAKVGLDESGLLSPILVFGLVHAVVQYETTVAQALMLQESLRNATAALWISRVALLATVVGVSGGLSITDALWISVASEAVGMIWLVSARRRHLQNASARDRPGSDKSRDRWPVSYRTVAAFGFQNYLMGQAAFASQARVQMLVAAAFLPAPLLAAFGFFRKLSDQVRIYLPFQLLQSVAEPLVIRSFLKTQSVASLNAMTGAMLKVNALIVTPLTVWIWVAGDPVVALVTDGKISGNQWILAALIASTLAGTFVTLLVVSANALGASRWLPLATIVASVSTVVVLWTQVSKLGVAALVWSDLVFGVIVVIILAFRLRAEFPEFAVPTRDVLRIALMVLPVALIAWGLREMLAPEPTVVSSGLLGVGIFATYGAINFVWKPFTEAERGLLQKIAGRKNVLF